MSDEMCNEKPESVDFAKLTIKSRTYSGGRTVLDALLGNALRGGWTDTNPRLFEVVGANPHDGKLRFRFFGVFHRGEQDVLLFQEDTRYEIVDYAGLGRAPTEEELDCFRLHCAEADIEIENG